MTQEEQDRMDDLTRQVVRLTDQVGWLESDNRMLRECLEAYLRSVGDLREKSLPTAVADEVPF
jgi:hypothetical protein